MADDFAISFRKTHVAPAAGPLPARAGLPLWLAAVFAAGIGFAGMHYWPALRGAARLVRAEPAPSRPPDAGAPPQAGPRVIASVPGIRETPIEKPIGILGRSDQPLELTYAAAGPVIIRTGASIVEVDGPGLLVPPAGRARTARGMLDHATALANALNRLAETPCDRHLRYLAAANINLFVAAYFPPMTPIRTDADANAAFWTRAEPSMVRRAAAGLIERGALGPADFGRDRSPEIKGLFLGVRQALPSCA